MIQYFHEAIINNLRYFLSLKTCWKKLVKSYMCILIRYECWYAKISGVFSNFVHSHHKLNSQLELGFQNWIMNEVPENVCKMLVYMR